jgi:hypothetical protein
MGFKCDEVHRTQTLEGEAVMKGFWRFSYTESKEDSQGNIKVVDTITSRSRCFLLMLVKGVLKIVGRKVKGWFYGNPN